MELDDTVIVNGVERNSEIYMKTGTVIGFYSTDSVIVLFDKPLRDLCGTIYLRALVLSIGILEKVK